MYTIAYRTNESEKGKVFKQPKLNVVTKYADQEQPTAALFDGKTDATRVVYLPAKPGYIMVSEYFKKEKTMRNRLEKVD